MAQTKVYLIIRKDDDIAFESIEGYATGLDSAIKYMQNQVDDCLKAEKIKDKKWGDVYRVGDPYNMYYLAKPLNSCNNKK